MADSSHTSPSHAWHGARGQAGQVRSEEKRKRRRTIYILAGIMLVLAGALAALVFYIRNTPEPALVVLRIDQGHFAVSPWAAQDRDGLLQLHMKENDKFTRQERQLLKEELTRLGRNQPAKQPLIVYMCAFAVVQDDGTVALLPADAKLDDPKTWLPIREVLEAIHASPQDHKLLLLDLGQPCLDPRAGIVAANVPERLKPALQAAVESDPKLQVLTACAPGQTSLPSEELGHTAFAHFIIQGLAGQADGFPNNDPDTRVTRRELVDYVTEQVDRWAYHTASLRQTPQYFGDSADYELVGTGSKERPSVVPLSSDYPDFLLTGWAERDKWWEESAPRTPPDLIVRFEQALLRAEDRWCKGADADKVKGDLNTELEAVRRQRAAGIEPPDRSEPRSLAEAVLRGQKPPQGKAEDWLRDLKELGKLWVAVKLPKANEKPSDMEAARLMQETEAFLKKYDGKRFDLAWTVFAAALADRELRWEYLRCWCDLLRAKGEPLPPYRELQSLQRLADLTVAKPDDWPPAAGDALQLVALAERVEALKPSRQPWLKAEADAARQQRADAEKLLYSAKPADRLQADQPLAAALLAYRDLSEHLALLRDAQRTCDDALVFLPGYAGYLEFEPSRVDHWRKAVEAARALHETLGQTPGAGQVQAMLLEVKEKASTLQNSLKALRDPLNSALARGQILNRQSLGATDWLEMRALLRFPGLKAPQRETVWKNARELGHRLNEEVAPRARTDTPAFAANTAVSDERGRALVRVKISLGMLRLAGVPAADLKKVEGARARAQDMPEDDTAWKALRDELRQAWKRQESASPRP